MQLEDKYLYDRLKHLGETDIYPYHMPGHKRNMTGCPLQELYDIDITEIEDFDNLHEAETILKDAMNRAAEFYESKQSYFLINGSSCGVLAALMSTVKKGGKVLFARNAHKSAYHAVMLGEMKPVYLYPDCVEEYGIAGGITAEAVEQALREQPDCQAVFLTSPTYDGVLSDVEGIVRAAHRYNIPVIVDEAHGAHLPLCSHAVSSVKAGADLVIHSIHKTLPAPTQTALLHKNGKLIREDRLKKYLQVFQSSSPSYVLMAGMDQCFRILEERGTALAAQFEENRLHFLKQIKPLKKIRVLCDTLSEDDKIKYGIKAMDRGKILISVKETAFTGKELYQILFERFRLQMEMAADSYVLAIMTIMDSREGFDRLAQALLVLDGEAAQAGSNKETAFWNGRNEIRIPLWEAENGEKEYRPLSESNDRTAAESIALYPPGIPVIVPGEIITEELITYLQDSLKKGLRIYGLNIEKTVPYISVLV